MTPLETRIYSHPPIPLADISALEVLILTNMLERSETEAGLILFTDVGPSNPIRVPRSELVAAFRVSAQNAEDPINIFIAGRVIALLPIGDNTVEDHAMIDIDLSGFPWQFVVQGIVARSSDLHEVSVIQWTNHPSQRPESFGVGVSLITAKAIHHATSEDLLGRFRRQDKALLAAASPVPCCRDNGGLAGGAASDLERSTRLSASGRRCFISAVCIRMNGRSRTLSPACPNSGMPSDGTRCGPMSARSCPSHSPSMTMSAKSLRKRVSPSISISRRHLSRPCAGQRTGCPAKANRKSSVKT